MENLSSDAKHPWLSHYPEGISWHAEMPQYPLWEILDRAAARYPKRVCIDSWAG
jgi:long-chain acyl-CoA synthetase